MNMCLGIKTYIPLRTNFKCYSGSQKNLVVASVALLKPQRLTIITVNPLYREHLLFETFLGHKLIAVFL